MAIAWYTDTAKDNPARQRVGTNTVPFAFTIVSNWLASIGDYLVLAKLPKYATLLAYWIDMPDCGTSGAADFGTRTSAARFKSAVTLVTAGVWTSYDITGTYYTAAALPYKVLDTTTSAITADDDVRLTATTAMTVWDTAKTIQGFVTYVCNEKEAMAEVHA